MQMQIYPENIPQFRPCWIRPYAVGIVVGGGDFPLEYIVCSYMHLFARFNKPEH
jgi:hypothetical protein